MARPRTAASNSPGALRFHHFEILLTTEGKPWILGRGAAGITYKAVDTILRRNVALKVVDERLMIGSAAKGGVIEEARTAATLQHPNLAAIHYFGEDGDACFYAMELVEGQSLEDYVKARGSLPPRSALDVAAQVAAALGAAHDLGIVHRDVKPANIMLASGEGERFVVKLVDFGLAAPLVASSPGNISGQFAGTPLYASPEQLDGVAPDMRSDVYSLGASLFFMLGGRPPFEGSGIADLARKHTLQDVPIHSLRGVSTEVSSLVLRLMAKDPGTRPLDGAEARAEIEECLRLYRQSADRAAREWMQNRFACIEQAGFLEGGVLYKAAQTRGAEELAVFHFDNSARGLVAADRMRMAVPMIRSIRSSSARRVIDMADTADGLVVVCEWMAGTRLLSLLRVRRSLPMEEAELILSPIAQALDEAVAAGMALPHVGLRDVFLQPSGNAGTPLLQWPDLRAVVDLLPLAEAREVDINATVVGRSLGVPGSVAYTTSGQDAANIVASLAYEILGGTTAPRSGFYVPLPELSESANRTLRRVFEQGATGITASALVGRLLGGEALAEWPEKSPHRAKPSPPVTRASAAPAMAHLPPPKNSTFGRRQVALTAVSALVAVLGLFAILGLRDANDAALTTSTLPHVDTPEVAEGIHVQEESFADLLAKANELETSASPGSALVPLEEALSRQPANAELLFRVASLQQRLSLAQQAEATWQRLAALGSDAGNLADVAEVQLNLLRNTHNEGTEFEDLTGLQPGSSLGVVDLKLSDGGDAANPVKNLRLAVRARPGESVDPSDVRINVTFYERLNGKIVPTMSRVQSIWFTSPVDWKSDGVEILEVKYEVPRIGPDGGPPPEYYGYMVNIYHRGQLQETRAEPADLQKLFPPPMDEIQQLARPPSITPQPINAPFGLKWGERARLIKRVISQAGATIVNWEDLPNGRQVWLVEGIKQNALKLTYFHFVNGLLDGIELEYERPEWDRARVASWVSTIKQQSDRKYGRSLRMSSGSQESRGDLIAKWRWPGRNGELRLSYFRLQEDGRDSDKVVLGYWRVL